MEDPAVIAFIDALEPTLKKQVEAIRKAGAKVKKSKVPALKRVITEWHERL